MRGVKSFFFQAEDGIRDYKVTGVQTCALPIWSSALSEYPTHGTTIDQASTQRCRYTRSSSGASARISSMVNLPGLLHRPSTLTVHGSVLKFLAYPAGSLLSVPNS